METEKIAQVDPSSTSIDSLLNDEKDQQNGIGLLESSQLTETTSSSIVTEPFHTISNQIYNCVTCYL